MDPTVRLDKREQREPASARLTARPRPAGHGSSDWAFGAAAALIAVVLVLSVVHLLPQLRNPFATTTIDRSSPVRPEVDQRA